MKYTILASAFILFSCTSQQEKKGEKTPSTIHYQKQLNNISTQFFLGKWNIVKKEISEINKNEFVIQEKKCLVNSYWEFKERSKGNIVQSKVTAVKDCKEYISTKEGNVTYKNGYLNYFIDDVMHSEKVNVLKKNKFERLEKEFIGGKHVIIKTTYERK